MVRTASDESQGGIRTRGNTEKLKWKPSTVLSPVPVVMLTCKDQDVKPNIITVAWVGTVCSDPPMLSVSVRPERHSHALIASSGEFVVNVPTRELTWATDYCGVASGRDVDKFERTGLTPGKAEAVGPPIIEECPLNIECVVTQSIGLGSHTMFIARVVSVQVSAELVADDGRLALERAGLITYAHGHYHSVGVQLGHFGFSVRRKPSERRVRR
ncbi:MAG: flavin reductase family protein [Clostridia bacterium]|nr:flavin reductase family protein [Clostridia bacterium]